MATPSRAAARFPRTSIVGWLLVVALTFLLGRTFGGDFENAVDLPGSDSSVGAALVEAHSTGSGAGQTARIVLQADSLADHADELDAAAARLRAVDGVEQVGDPLEAGTLSQDGTTGFLSLRLDAAPKSLGGDSLDEIQAAFDDVDAEVEVSYAGQLGAAIDGGGGRHLPEVLGLVMALLVLLVSFGSVLGAVVPIVTAASATLVGIALLGITATAATFPVSAPTLATMIGLGCGIDYALFITTRFRRLVMDGLSGEQAARQAVTKMGPAVMVAACTVAMALTGLYASGITFVGRLGTAATITLATASLAAVTLTPAILSLAGRRVDRARVRRQPVAEGGGEGGPRGRRYVAVRHPWLAMVAALVVLGTLAIPLLSLDLGHLDEGDDARGSTTRQAYEAMASGFGPGSNAALTTVLDLRGQPQPAAAEEVAQSAIARTPGVASVSPFRLSADGQIAIADVVPYGSPEAESTASLVERLRTQTATRVEAETGARLLVTGATAAQVDLEHQISERLPLVIGLVVAASLVLLTVSFASPVVAIKAALMNLLSIGASYGVLVAVFQWQWGSSALGLDHAVPIESFVPMMMFVIVFGLSMDYEVFLLSRIREEWLATGDNTAAVTAGLRSTSRVITAAALIMISVFAGFALDDDVTIKMLAVGLAVSVLIDATLVRLVLVPAVMVLLGPANWAPIRLPRRLTRGSRQECSSSRSSGVSR